MQIFERVFHIFAAAAATAAARKWMCLARSYQLSPQTPIAKNINWECTRVNEIGGPTQNRRETIADKTGGGEGIRELMQKDILLLIQHVPTCIHTFIKTHANIQKIHRFKKNRTEFHWSHSYEYFALQKWKQMTSSYTKKNTSQIILYEPSNGSLNEQASRYEKLCVRACERNHFSCEWILKYSIYWMDSADCWGKNHHHKT